MKIKVLLNLKDLYIFSILRLYTKPSYQFIAAISLLSIVSLPFTGLKMNISSDYNGPVLQTLLVRLVIPLIILLIPLISFSTIKKNMGQDKRFNEEVEYFVSGFGIMSESVSFTSKRNWQEIREVDERKWYFALHITDNQTILLPKRCFDSSDMILEFKDLLRNHLPKKIYK